MFKPIINLFAQSSSAACFELPLPTNFFEPEIDTEILFINSTEDKVVSPEHIQNFAKRFKNSKIIKH